MYTIDIIVAKGHTNFHDCEQINKQTHQSMNEGWKEGRNEYSEHTNVHINDMNMFNCVHYHPCNGHLLTFTSKSSFSHALFIGPGSAGSTRAALFVALSMRIYPIAK